MKYDTQIMANYIEDLMMDFFRTDDEVRAEFLKKFPGEESFYVHYTMEKQD